jgi:hypothetical protein
VTLIGGGDVLVDLVVVVAAIAVAAAVVVGAGL